MQRRGRTMMNQDDTIFLDLKDNGWFAGSVVPFINPILQTQYKDPVFVFVLIL